MRITSIGEQQLSELLLKNRATLSEQQARISSGQRYLRRSDEPQIAAQAASLARQVEVESAWGSNIATASTWETHTQGGLERMMENLQRLRELSIAGRNGATPAADLALIGQEIKVMIEELVGIANQRHGGHYLFAGTSLDTPPLAVSRVDGEVTGVAYVGGAGRQVPVGSDMRIGYGMTAEAMTGIIDAAISLRDELAAGSTASEASQSQMDGALDSLASELVQSGLRQQRLTRLQSALGSRETIDAAQLGQLRDLDLTAAITELSRLQVTFQASLQMTASLNRLSLLNYL